MEKKRFSIFAKMSLIYGLVFAICLTLLASIITIINYYNQKKSTLEISKEVLNARAEHIGEWLESLIIEAKISASNSVFKTEDKDLIKAELSVMRANFDDNHQAPSFTNKNGDFIAADGNSGNIADSDYFKTIISGEKDFVVSNPVVSKAAEVLVFPVVYKITGIDNKPIGLFMAPMKLDYLSEIVDDIKMGTNGNAWIADQTSMLIAHQNKDLVYKMMMSKASEMGYKGMDEAGEDIIQQKSGIRLALRGDGTKLYLIYKTIPNSPGWTLGVTVAVTDLFKDIIASIKITVFITIILLAIIIILTLVIAGNIVKPIKVVALAAKELSMGNIELKGIEQSEKDKILNRNDELGATAYAMEELISYLGEKEEIAKEMAEGNLDVAPKVAAETDNFGIAFKNLVESLNISLFNVIKSSEQVDVGSNQVSQASQSLSQGATEQASSLEEITSSITEISSQAKQNADNALQASGLAKQAMGNAEDGNKQMQELVEAMANITKSAEAIKTIVKVIDDIAFQTNLLALNANVEAARAGKYGKGFAVVAEEVRNLAGRSAVSVKETTDMVEDTVKNILKGNNLVEITAKQLKEIMDSSSKVADIVEEIATASREQTQGLDQINQGLSQIDQVTQANTANAEESASAAEELAGQAQELKIMVNKFKLKNTRDTILLGNDNVPSKLMKKVRKEIGNSMGEKKELTVNSKNMIKLDDDDFEKF